MRGIDFNMINKNHTLPIVYTMLVKIRKFQSLLFYEVTKFVVIMFEF